MTILQKRQFAKLPYLRVFLIGFVTLLAVILPIVIFDGGYFIYYGDFNSQQIPFYTLAHDAVRSGSLGWSWTTDLGSNFIGSYSFYLLGSPFFWLTIPFPSGAVPYLMPWLLCLKHAFATLTAYAYLRRFVKRHNAALIGALLYAFSGFQAYNLFFNHFQDVTAFFPLLLIALEERVNNNRRGVFALTTALMAMINYFFFTGQVVFVVLYFIIRCFCKDFRITWRKFFGIALESVLGVMLSAVLLLPSAMAILGNGRITEHLSGLDMVTYSDRTRIWRIIQSFFMIPDAPARPNLFSSESAKWASIAGYLPVFSMTGVIAFAKSRRKHWATRLTLLCVLCAMIPIFNSAFYALNGAYYARWFYMPVLIMALMTAISLDDPAIELKPGITVSGIMLGLFAVFACFPTKDEAGETLLFRFANYPVYFVLLLCISAAGVGYVAYYAYQKRRGLHAIRQAGYFTIGGCILCTAAVVYFGVSLGPYPKNYINTAIRGGEEISLEREENQFWRIDISRDYDNYPMFWGYSNMRAFQSVVPSSIMEFYDAIGITRDVASRAPLEDYTLRGLFSVKYYLDRAYSDAAADYTYTIDLPGFTYKDTQNGFYVYENDYYVPMGFTYESYALEKDLEERSSGNIERQLISALVLTEAQAERYGAYLTPITQAASYGITEEEYLTECQKRTANSCDTFVYDSYGFTGTITLEQPNLVFFSVPYDEGWTATVNGKQVKVEKVSYGFMAVLAETGENEIVFSYETVGLHTGAWISLAGLLLLVLYLLLLRKRHRRELQTEPMHVCFYDYTVTEPVAAQLQYEAQLQRRRKRKEKPRKAEGEENASE